MRLVPIALFLLALSISAPAFGDGLDIPARKPGRWWIGMGLKFETVDDFYSSFAELCVDARTDRTLMEGAIGYSATCKPPSQSRNGNERIIDLVCDDGGITKTLHIILGGDFQSQYTLYLSQDKKGGLLKVPEQQIRTQYATWMGECSEGMKPGDLLMPDGSKLNALPREAR